MHKGAWKDEIHIFEYEGRDILYQVRTGVFFEADALVTDILACDEARSKEAVIAGLSSRYGLEHIVGAIEEMEGMDILSFGPRPPLEAAPDTECGPDSCAPLPITITLHVAHACNLNCAYCFAFGGNYGGKSELMDFATAKAAIDWLLTESADAGRCHVDFFGGEPLLNFPLIKRVVPYARARAAKQGVGISFGMTTNGTILSPEILAFIMRHNIGLIVSLDGKAPDHNRIRTFHDGSPTYDVIAENVRRITAACPEQVILRATMTSHNLDIGAIAGHLSRFCPESVEVAPVTEAPTRPTAIRAEHLPALKRHLRKLSRAELICMVDGRRAPHAFFEKRIEQLLARRKKEYHCGGGKALLGVSVDGSLYFCSSLVGMSEFKMGDVFNGIAPGKKRRFDRDLYVDDRQPCGCCWARYLCGGGCIYDAQVTNATPSTPNAVSCEQTRYAYELAMGMSLQLREEAPTAFETLCEAAD